jgi:hypothetical protein
MELILASWIVFFSASFAVSILALSFVQLRAISRYGLRESMERAQRAPLDMYWRDLSPLERCLVWPGLVAFGVTFLAAATAAVTWGVVPPDAK